MTSVAPVPGSRPLLRIIRLVAAVAIAVVSLAYMVAALRHAPDALRGVAWTAHPWLLAAGLALHALCLSLGCMLWWYVLERLVPRVIAPGRLWHVWALTNPARYIPGRIWHVSSLGALLRSAGVPVGATLTSIAIHMWLFMLAGTVVGSTLVVAAPWPAALRVFTVVLVLAGAALGTHPTFLRVVSGLLARLSRQPTLVWHERWGTSLRLGAAHVGIHVVTGLAACVLLRATAGLALEEVPRVVAANAVAFLVGYVSLVPAGLGVREAMLTLLLSPAAPVGSAAADAVILRAGATATELLLAAMVLVVPAVLRITRKRAR